MTWPPRTLLIDVGLCLVVAVPALVQQVSAASVIPLVGAIVVIVARRRWPVPTLAVGYAAAIASVAVWNEPTALLPACVILIFNVAVRTNRATTLAALLAGLIGVGICLVLLDPDRALGPVLLAAIAWPTLAAAAGEATRTRAEVVAAAIERAERAERSREEEARRRVAEERLHIARELHDLVAHNMAVVNVQAGVAEHFLTRDPSAAAAALQHVRESSRAVLDEMAEILGVLRSADDTGDSQRTPTPTVDQISGLVSSFQSSGREITFVTSGECHPLDAIGALAAYRTVQEALANALKHGTGTVRLALTYEDALRITVTNSTSANEASTSLSSGFGLAGMRERVAIAGGTVSVHTGDGRFEVEVTIPYSTGATDTDPPIRSREPDSDTEEDQEA